MPDYPIDYVHWREVRPPVTAAHLRPLSPKCRTVQFSVPLTEGDHKKLAKFMRNYPQIQLRVYGHYFQKCDLGFLRHYSTVRHLAVQVFEVEDFDALKFVSPDLESLALGHTKGKGHSLSFLQMFPRLRRMYIEEHAKDIAAIGTLSRLEDLTLRSITLPDLSVLKPLRQLRSLAIKLGGTKNLELLPEIGYLRYLELWMIRGLTDLKPISSVRTLQFLFLQALKNVKVLPSFTGLPNLRRIHLETMKGLRDLRPAPKAPALEELVAVDMGHLELDAFRPFIGHATLRKARIGLGSNRKNKAVADLLRLPTVDEEFTFKDANDRG